MGLTSAGAHANTGMKSLKRRSGSKRVTTDVTKDKSSKLLQGVKQRSVGTARTKIRRSPRKVFRFYPYYRCFILFSFEGFLHDLGSKLIHGGNNIFTVKDLIAHSFYLSFKERIKLFHNYHLFNVLKKLCYHLFRKGPYHAELQIRIFGKNLFRVHVCRSACNHTYVFAIYLHAVVFERVGIGLEIPHPFFDKFTPRAYISRYHDIFRCIFGIKAYRHLRFNSVTRSD